MIHQRLVRHAALLLLAGLALSCAPSPTLPDDVANASAELGLFGLPAPGAVPEVFAPGVVSLEGRYEYAISIAPEGDELMFSTEAPGERAAVFHSRFENGAWSEPASVSLSGGQRPAEMEAFYSPDGRWIYFAPFDTGMDVRLWRVTRADGAWHTPQPLGAPIPDVPAFYPVASGDGTLYFTNIKERAIYRTVGSAGDAAGVEPAGLPRAGHAFIAPDASYLLVDARVGEGTKSDIFVAFPDGAGGWSALHPLGGDVNTPFSETCPSVSPDGKLLFFSRYNEEGEVSNIYWVDASVISRASAGGAVPDGGESD